MEDPDKTIFAPRCLSIDLEVGKSDGRIHQFAGIRGDTGDQLVYTGGSLAQAFAHLDALAEGAAFILGHNVIDFDLPHIQAAAPDLTLLKLPVIDTLRLNPLAFPRNPYHHLVKHYQDGQIQRGRLNDPELDARLTLSLFVDQRTAFLRLHQSNPALLTLWHGLTTLEEGRSGLNAFFTTIRKQTRPSDGEIRQLLQSQLAAVACRTQIGGIVEADLAKAPWALAYGLAWLSVAGGDSVMPPWVWHQFPESSRIVRLLRDTPCSDPTCTWCQEHHNARKALIRWFGFPDFRSTPQGPGGRPLQQSIVEAAMAGQHTLGILPTGTGKSLCYQIPALSRFENTGALTVVISPLVALMADQVAGLEQRGITMSAALYGLLSMPERGDVLDRVRLGSVGILIISPEQLRNRGLRQVLAQREIGAWVLDEAHCLSKWGHDFRPDYRYVGRFIREWAHGDEIPPILCLTATAKPDVVTDIVQYFNDQLGIALAVFNGGSERTNLDFLVIPTTEPEKRAQVYEVLMQYLPADIAGGAIVYAATRKQAEAISEFLGAKGLMSAFYHAGLPPETKKQTQQRFIGGDLRVIVATNAFGMGIDKQDVRLVIHADIPGSLENYLQEAGRAGRDQEQARCVLLYTPHDVEKQFGMSSRSRLTRSEIQSVLRALRRLNRKKQLQGEVIATSGEILAEEDDGDFARDRQTEDTRVRTAVAWLEEASLLTREENRISVFPSSLRVTALEDAQRRLAKAEMTQAYRNQLLGVIRAMISADPDEGISTDALMGLTGLDSAGIRRAFADLERLDLATNDMVLTAFVHRGVERASGKRLETTCSIEKALLHHLRELGADVATGEVSHLGLRTATNWLHGEGFVDVLPDTVWRLIKGIAADGREDGGGKGSLEIKKTDRDTVRIIRLREWEPLLQTAELRRTSAQRLLQHLLDRLPDAARGTDLLVDTTMGHLMTALTSDLVLAATVKDPVKLLDRALLWLHEMEIIRLNRGLTVFRPAMTIRLDPDRRPFQKTDFVPLELHYAEQVVQVHIMAEYAERGLRAVAEALRLAADYFALDRESFISRWLPRREAELKRQTTPASWRQIVEDLRNPAQQSIVADEREETNVLVLAGPGSGKTRVLVHRIAFLIRVRREPPRSILALAYNHHAAVEIRRRLQEMIGDESRSVTVLTCHALAMRLMGVSFAERSQDTSFDFTEVLLSATRLLQGTDALPEEADALRERLLAGYRWILVDEYQDIDAPQYNLISALTGRTLREGEGKLTIFAVGDDDQNIYAFKGASVAFIRRFENDYQAKSAYLTENYRSTAHIISAANQLIGTARNRMKKDQPIQINRARMKLPPGGDWETWDPVARGRVQILEAGPGAENQAVVIMEELQRLSSLHPNWEWRKVAVIGRNWKDLDPVRAWCEWQGIPAQTGNHATLPLWGLRETQQLRDWIFARGYGPIPLSEVEAWLAQWTEGPWWDLLRDAFRDFGLEVGKAEPLAQQLLDWLVEWLRDTRLRQIGLFLTTAHGAKGREFDHVAVLDGDWLRVQAGEDPDAPKRLFYVAMTRARQTLLLAKRESSSTLLLDLLPDTPALLRRQPPINAVPMDVLYRRYQLLDLADVDLGFAGRYMATAPIHGGIKQLRPGDPLNCDLIHRTLHTESGFQVGRLARAYQAPEGLRCIQASVAAIVVWSRDKTEEAYRQQVAVARWEVVIPELVFAP